jgi:hypothetical protein
MRASLPAESHQHIPGSLCAMFHLQLRQFPHNHCQFNLTAEELRAFTGPWAGGDWIELGERKWSPHQAKLTVIEGPAVALEQLSMGRGWSHAKRHGEDVTATTLDAARASPLAPVSEAEAAAAARAPGDSDAALAVLRSLLGDGPRAEALLAVWRYTAARFPDRSPSDCLALAERQLDSPVEEPGEGASADG